MCSFYIWDVVIIKRCCAFGHREIFNDISEDVYNVVMNEINAGIEIFYCGCMGSFDNSFAYAVSKAKKNNPNIKLICVKPYMTKELNYLRYYYEELYDDIIIPSEIKGCHYKSAITLRNKWMVDLCDSVIFYLKREYGGTYTAYKYAKRKNKKITII